MENVWRVLVFSISSFVFLFVVMKILGKKQIAELSFIDYVVGISIGSIAAEWSTAMDVPFYHYVIAISVYCIFTLLLDIIERKKTFTREQFAASINEFLAFRRYQILPNGEKGQISAAQAKAKAAAEYDVFNRTQPIESDFDKAIKKLSEAQEI